MTAILERSVSRELAGSAFFERLDLAARRWTATSFIAGRLLLTSAALSALCAGLAYLILGEGDQHQPFRNFGPVSFFSLLLTLAIASLGLLIARREAGFGLWRDLTNFWLLAGAGFVFLAIDQLTDLHGQAGILMEDYLTGKEPLGFHGGGDLILGLYLLAGLVLALIYQRELSRNKGVLAQFIAGAFLVACTVIIDGFVEQTSWVWVLEETLKLFAGSFLLGAFALRFRIAVDKSASPSGLGLSPATT